VRVVVYCCRVCGHAVDESNMRPGRGCFGPLGAGHARAERVRVELPGITCADGMHLVCADPACTCECHRMPARGARG